MKEIWKPVVGYEGLYKVSNLGRIKSIGRLRKGNKCFYKSKDKILKPSTSIGYSVYLLTNNGDKKGLLGHRIVLFAFKGKCPDGFQGSHLDGDSLNNNINNLEWESPSDNCSRRTGHGTQVFLHGELCHSAKFTDKEVLEIRDRYKNGGITQKAIALELGVTRNSIWRIINKKTWSHI